jgi:hypothetical protein
MFEVSYLKSWALDCACHPDCSALLEIQYLLQFWDISYACQLDGSSNLADHYGASLAQRGALVDLK